jgi:hypothetical protein
VRSGAARSRAFRFFPLSLSPSNFFLFVCFALSAFVCVSLNAAAFAKSDHWTGCRSAGLDARIAGCTKVIARGSREIKRDQLTAYINRGGA